MFIKRDENGIWDNSTFWDTDTDIKIINFAIMLNEYDPKIRHLDYLLGSCEEIFCTIRERIDEFDDCYIQSLEKCNELICNLQDRIRVEIGMRIEGLYEGKFEKAMERENSQIAQFHKEAC